VAAMESTGVARVVALSSPGVRDDDPHLAFWYRWRRSFARARSIGPSSAPPTSRTGRPPGPTGSRTAPPRRAAGNSPAPTSPGSSRMSSTATGGLMPPPPSPTDVSLTT
jgi:hypothetical protein